MVNISKAVKDITKWKTHFFSILRCLSNDLNLFFMSYTLLKAFMQREVLNREKEKKKKEISLRPVGVKLLMSRIQT